MITPAKPVWKPTEPRFTQIGIEHVTRELHELQFYLEVSIHKFQNKNRVGGQQTLYLVLYYILLIYDVKNNLIQAARDIEGEFFGWPENFPEYL